MGISSAIVSSASHRGKKISTFIRFLHNFRIICFLGCKRKIRFSKIAAEAAPIAVVEVAVIIMIVIVEERVSRSAPFISLKQNLHGNLQ